ncbi:FkbM family methyltransferase [Streptomyces cupreus]|uniref:FkbM family methyltransferase n=1 Tax=Streptomyces cupreus TaxID=2759956 RepID=A0A7X1J662_9ACTN|nr:FkbM family methyltransferase [Streptomyces cupreus]MBC2902397.1 FkbM family methyltransferase [Streptomyces cupreus]
MTPAARRSILLRGVNVLLDVGANRGQYAQWIRTLGYSERIVSFEPTSEAFGWLAKAAAGDPMWQCHNLALGADDSDLDLRVSRDSCSTSAFAPTGITLRNYPDAATIARERVAMRRLGSLWNDLHCTAPIYLKVDAEGSELAVLEGAGAVLDQIAFLELELSLVPTYVGAPLIGEILRFVEDRGFATVALEGIQGDDHSTGQMLMLNGIFRNIT